MASQTTFRPRRSCLYMPGANTRALQKARSLPADTVILDLEDSVAPGAKDEAREAVRGALDDGGYGGREVLVRVNSLDSPWGREDLRMAVSAPVHGVLVPKVVDAQQVMQLDLALNEAGASADLPLWIMIETPAAVLNIAAIAATAQHTRLGAMVLGLNDLALETGAMMTAGRGAFHVALSLSVMAARAHGLVVIDGVFNDFRDDAGLVQECEQGRMLGFDGKTLIHPAQLEIANRVFAPDPAEVEHAHKVIAAFALPENSGKGVIQVDGKMTELLHLQQAQRLVAISEAIAALD